jgi:hypothetical protein
LNFYSKSDYFFKSPLNQFTETKKAVSSFSSHCLKKYFFFQKTLLSSIKIELVGF